jgi:GT2 family glycosyltransferase
MMNIPEISVIVPSFCDGDNLGRCLEALNGQSIRSNIETVVSIDGGVLPPEHVLALADVVIEGEHCGPAAARNRGWKGSAGEIVLFTDSDCIPHYDWAEQMLKVFRNGADAVKGVYSEGGNRAIQRLAQIEFEERYKLLSKHETIDLIDTYSGGFRRSVLERTGGFDESFPLPDHEDVDLSYRAQKEGYILRFAPEAKVAHQHRSTWRAYFRMKYSRGRWRVKVLRRFPRKTGSDTYTPVCLKLQILLIPLLILSFFLTAVAPAVPAALGIVFLISLVPLLFRAYESDRVLMPIVPIFALWRACALFSGLCRGIFASEEVNK